MPLDQNLNFINDSENDYFKITLNQINGQTAIFECSAQYIPSPECNAGWSSCQQAVPDGNMVTSADQSAQCMLGIFPQIADESYTDQNGIVAAAISWAIYQKDKAESLYDCWRAIDNTCSSNWNLYTYHCSKRKATCKMRGFFSMFGSDEIGAAETKALQIYYVWADLVKDLLLIQKNIADAGSQYSTLQTAAAEFTLLTAQINEQIAASNVGVQQAELSLLELKNKELSSKAMYILAPLLLIVGIALIFNE